MAKDKKAGKKSDTKGETEDRPFELIAGPTEPKASKKGKKGKKGSQGGDKHAGGLEALSKLADHPLLGDLLAVGALAAVAAIAESGKNDPAAVKSTQAVKAAGKAAAAAIGARLLKEMAATGSKDTKA